MDVTRRSALRSRTHRACRSIARLFFHPRRSPGATTMTSKTVLVLAVLAPLAAGANARAQQGPLKDPIPFPIRQSPIQVTLKPVAAGLTSPIFLTVADDNENDGRDNDGGDGDHGDRGDHRRTDRKFVVDQTGLILVMKGGVLQPTPFLDIT